MKDELLKVIDYYQIPYEEKIICPFHGDVNPSLKLNIDENFWFCFGCPCYYVKFKFLFAFYYTAFFTYFQKAVRELFRTGRNGTAQIVRT